MSGREGSISTNNFARISCAASAALLAVACSPGDEERVDAAELNQQADPVLNAMASPAENLTAEDLMDNEPAAQASDEPVASDPVPAAAGPAPAARRAQPAAPAPPGKRTPPPPAPAPPPPPPAEDPHAGHDMNSM